MGTIKQANEGTLEEDIRVNVDMQGACFRDFVPWLQKIQNSVDK